MTNNRGIPLHALLLLGFTALHSRAADAKASPSPPGQGDHVQAVAYYFPDWSRPPGNMDRVFAEWWYLENAIPRFSGHAQPKRPVWGYEDESDPAVMAKKTAVAADHGLSGFVFCWYYHAQGPFIERALHDGYLKAANRAQLPFAIMWANHDIAPLERVGAVTPEVFEAMTTCLGFPRCTLCYTRTKNRVLFGDFALPHNPLVGGSNPSGPTFASSRTVSHSGVQVLNPSRLRRSDTATF